MKIPDLFPSSDLLSQIEGVEQGLKRRHRLGRLGLIVTFVQLALLVANSGWVTVLGNVTKLPPWFVAVVATFAVVGVVLFAWSKFWLRESNQPFHYTYWIGPFERVASSASDASGVLGWLPHDLSELLSKRIGRLSLLEEPPAVAPAGSGKPGSPNGNEPVRTSHIHVRGHWLIRPNRDGTQWVVEVSPQVRIGPQGNPERLAHRVRYYLPIEAKDPPQPSAAPSPSATPAAPAANNGPGTPPEAAAPLALKIERRDYDRILERVYFSVASQIYGQIKTDVQRKIDLLPTPYLRANAYFQEAEDYAASNTVDAYRSARDLYRNAADLLTTASVTPAAHWSDLPHQWMHLLRRYLNRPRRWGLAVSWSAGSTNTRLLLGRAWTGYASMLLYHRLLAGISGQRLNPIYEARPMIRNAVLTLEMLPSHPARDAALFAAYVTEALAWQQLGSAGLMACSLAKARVLDARQAEENSRYLFVQGLAEPSLQSQIPLLREAVELDPVFEVALYQLAYALDMQWRSRPSLELASAVSVTEAYGQVLELNPGNVSAWASLGYLQWLMASPDITAEPTNPKARVGDPHPSLIEANRSFRSGREYKEITEETYVAELDLGLARVYAEGGDFDRAYRYFESAREAYLTQGAHHNVTRQTMASYYFEFISTALLQRFQAYFDRVERYAEAPERSNTPRIRDAVLAFVLNDYGEAQQYSYELTGDVESRWKAQGAFERAVELDREKGDGERNVLPLYNLCRLLNDSSSIEKRVERAKEIVQIEPHWPDGQLNLADAYADWLPWGQKQIPTLEHKLKRLSEEREHKLAIQAELEKEMAGAAPVIRDADSMPLQPYLLAGHDHVLQPANAGESWRAERELVRKLSGLKKELEALDGEITRCREKRETVKNSLEQVFKDAERNAVDECLPPHPWLFHHPEGEPRSKASAAHFDWEALDASELDLEYRWERELDELQVRALQTWGRVLATGARLPSGVNTNERAKRAEALLGCLERHFLPPDDFVSLVSFRQLLVPGWEQRWLNERAPYFRSLLDQYRRRYPGAFWPLTWVDESSFSLEECKEIFAAAMDERNASAQTRLWLGWRFLDLAVRGPDLGAPASDFEETPDQVRKLCQEEGSQFDVEGSPLILGLRAFERAAEIGSSEVVLEVVDLLEATGRPEYLFQALWLLERLRQKEGGEAGGALGPAPYAWRRAHLLLRLGEHAEAVAVARTIVPPYEGLADDWRTRLIRVAVEGITNAYELTLWRDWLLDELSRSPGECRDAQQAFLFLVRHRGAAAGEEAA